MYKIRKAKLGDEVEIAHVHVNSWKSTYKGLIPDSFLNSLSVESRTSMWAESIKQMQSTNGQMFVLVCEDTFGKIIGFIAVGADREEQRNFDGELYALYLNKELKGKGWGKRLISESTKLLMESGYKSMRVWVLENNPACGFYEKLGGKLLSSTKTLKFEEKTCTAISYGWNDLGIFSSLL